MNDDLIRKIDFAIQEGLFESQNNIEEKYKIFDQYGNYYFPTDFSNSEWNTIATIEKSDYFICKLE